MEDVAGFIGIDAGTQGLSVVFTDPSMRVLATGEGAYDLVPGLETGCYEQSPGDWIAALKTAMQSVREQIKRDHGSFEVLAIGISGQMHGEVLADDNGEAVGPARLWCDARNEEESRELTELLGVKMPKRITAARWLWTLRHQPAKAALARRMTTPAGWLAYCLTGEWLLGIGDAAGMFPIDQSSMSYHAESIAQFDQAAGGEQSLATMLPTPRRAGEDGGTLTEAAADWLQLPVGIPVAPAEGDQPAALAGSLIGKAGLVSVSFGTSVCANAVGDRTFVGVDDAIDHFCAPDGKPINMVFLRNGSTFMNATVEMFGSTTELDRADSFAAMMPQLLAAPADCGGIIALPFLDDEPGLGVSTGGSAGFVGLTASNATAGNMAKAALLATMFNLRKGIEVLDSQDFPRSQIVLSGGLTKTPELAQLLADVMKTPVVLLDSAEEGTAWGAALLAKFRHQVIESGAAGHWAAFLESHATGTNQSFQPGAASEDYDRMYATYLRLLDSSHPSIIQSLATSD